LAPRREDGATAVGDHGVTHHTLSAHRRRHGHDQHAPKREPLLLTLSLLTLVTGLVDAACYLGLGRVFTANMTGNVVLLAFGAAGALPQCR
jgi:Protein of unknown function (DUF1275)